jgi:2-aminomuconate deaminase
MRKTPPNPWGCTPMPAAWAICCSCRASVPRNPETDGVPGLKRSPTGNFTEFDFEAQVHSVFRNVRAVLESSGARWEDLVDVTVFLTDMQRDFHTFNRIYAEYFHDNQPCRTTVGIDSLPTPIAIELKCVAVVG